MSSTLSLCNLSSLRSSDSFSLSGRQSLQIPSPAPVMFRSFSCHASTLASSPPYSVDRKEKEDYKGFLHIDDFDQATIKMILDRAKYVKAATESMNGTYVPLNGKKMATISYKGSLAQGSFVKWVGELGAGVPYFEQIGKMDTLEKTRDVALKLSRCNDILIAHDINHQAILDLARYASVPVLNGMSDYNHPGQIMTDAFTMIESKNIGRLEGTKVVCLGDGNNIVHSWLLLASVLPIHIVCACPKGFEPDQKTVEKARQAGISKIEITNDAKEAVKGADVVYTTNIRNNNDFLIEDRLQDFQVYEDLMQLAGPKAIFMDSSPSEIGMEVIKPVFEGSNSVVSLQAENCKHVQNTIMLYALGLLDKACGTNGSM